MKLTAELVENAVNGMDTFGGIEFRSYSGRGMYGDQCAAVSVEDLSQLVKLGVSIAYEVAASAETEDDSVLLEEIENAISDMSDPQIDSLGTGYVVYWPGIKVLASSHS